MAYALFRDGNEFIHVFLNLKADESVTGLPAFKTLQSDIAVPPTATRLAAKLVDSCGVVATTGS